MVKKRLDVVGRGRWSFLRDIKSSIIKRYNDSIPFLKRKNISKTKSEPVGKDLVLNNPPEKENGLIKNKDTLLQQLTNENKKYIEHISKARKKFIHEGIKKQRKVFEKLKIDSEKNPLPTEVEKINVMEKGKMNRVKAISPVKAVSSKVNSLTGKSAGKLDLGSIKAQVEKKLKNVKDTAVSKKGVVREFLKTGIPGFDDLFEHGVPKGNAVIVAGGTGSGKTIFCLQTSFNRALRGEKCLYMSFEESEEHLKQHLLDFGWDPEKVKKNLMIKRFSSFDVTRSVDALLMKEKGELLIDVEPVIFPSGFKPSFIVVDSLTAIASAFTGKEDSYRIYIEQLFRFFERKSVTSFLITETKQIPDIFSATGVEEFLADGVIVLYAIKRGNIRENAIEVLKMRGEHHQKKIVAMQISDKGITVFPEQEVFGEMESK